VARRGRRGAARRDAMDVKELRGYDKLGQLPGDTYKIVSVPAEVKRELLGLLIESRYNVELRTRRPSVVFGDPFAASSKRRAPKKADKSAKAASKGPRVSLSMR
jgi:hypothetical protein